MNTKPNILSTSHYYNVRRNVVCNKNRRAKDENKKTEQAGSDRNEDPGEPDNRRSPVASESPKPTYVYTFKRINE